MQYLMDALKLHPKKFDIQNICAVIIIQLKSNMTYNYKYNAIV